MKDHAGALTNKRAVCKWFPCYFWGVERILFFIFYKIKIRNYVSLSLRCTHTCTHAPAPPPAHHTQGIWKWSTNACNISILSHPVSPYLWFLQRCALVQSAQCIIHHLFFSSIQKSQFIQQQQQKALKTGLELEHPVWESHAYRLHSSCQENNA